MANRIVKIMGRAYAESGDASFVMTVDGQEVHNGIAASTITGSNNVVPGESTTEVELGSFEISETKEGIVPVVINVIAGNVVFVRLDANHTFLPGTYADLSPEGKAAEATIEKDNTSPEYVDFIPMPKDKHNVIINSEVLQVNDNFDGYRHVNIPENGTMTCDITLTASGIPPADRNTPMRWID